MPEKQVEKPVLTPITDAELERYNNNRPDDPAQILVEFLQDFATGGMRDGNKD